MASRPAKNSDPEDRKIELLVIGPLPPPYGGVANFIHNSVNQEQLRSQCNVTVLRTGKVSRSTPAAVQAMKEIGQFASFVIKRRYREADVIHIHTSSYWGFIRNMSYILLTKNFSDAALIIHVHGGKFKEFYEESLMPSLVRSTLNSADNIIVTSPSWIDVIHGICGKEARVESVPNGFDSTIFKPIDKMEARERLGLPKDKKILLAIGYLEEVKGHRFLIEAMKEVALQRNDVVLYIIGTGSLKDRLSGLASDLGIGDKVFFEKDGKPPEEISLWINSADLFVLPSLHEGSPTVMFECLGCGKPMVGTRVGGVPDVIASDEVGLVCDPSDSAGLTACIVSALNRSWDEDRIVDYAKQFTWESIASELSRIYQETLRQA